MNFSCLDSRQLGFGFGDETLSFDDAENTCNSFNASLAVIDSNELFDFVRKLSEDQLTGDISFWIGLRDVDEKVSGNNPLRFSPIIGEANKTFFATPNEFPWHSTQPNGNTQSPKQQCVGWKISGVINNVPADNEWFDAQCSSKRNFLCGKECEAINPDSNTTIEDKLEKSVENIQVTVMIVMAFIFLSIVLLMTRLIKKTARLEFLNDKIEEARYLETERVEEAI